MSIPSVKGPTTFVYTPQEGPTTFVYTLWKGYAPIRALHLCIIDIHETIQITCKTSILYGRLIEKFNKKKDNP